MVIAVSTVVMVLFLVHRSSKIQDVAHDKTYPQSKD